MLSRILLWGWALLAFPCLINSQIDDSLSDSLYINEIEGATGREKVLHAEPLFIDLIRDLGARKGEKEWNIGLGLTDKLRVDSYEALIEYEWAPVDRLGLEVELPFTFYAPLAGTPRDSIPGSKLNSLKLAAQWSFYVNPEHSLSMALGYIHEFELQEFRSFHRPYVKGHVFNPFFIAAKRWGSNFHTLVYTGPMIEQDMMDKALHVSFDVNSNIHYMISGTRNFIGIEFNKSIRSGDFDMTIRPQMRVGIADNLLVGIVGGIPIVRENERVSSFVRLIWEPGHRAIHK